LLFQKVDEFADKITAYREARRRAGHPGRGQVTLMLHTYVGRDEAEAKSIVREPFKAYLKSSVDLWQVGTNRLKDLPERKKADILEFAFERYYQKTGLMGGLENCRQMVQSVAAAGADEIASLIDFALPPAKIIDGLTALNELRKDAGR